MNAQCHVTYDGSLVHFHFAIPRGHVGPPGEPGIQGSPGEVSQAQLDSAINGTSANINLVGTLDNAFADPDLEQLRQKMNELILNGRR
jgi:hypothetical protein